MNSNKKLGNGFERTFCEMLAEDNFWCHNMAQKSEGQPADIIAVKNGKGFLIDCKVCTSNAFATSRIEPNQHTAMKLWQELDNGTGWFALLLQQSNEVWLISYETFKEHPAKFYNQSLISELGLPYERWVAMCK